MKSSLERGATYYSIAYTPENRNWDSRYRKVQVKVDQPGVKEDYRKGYFAMPNPKPEQEDAQRLVAAMQPGMPDATMLVFGARVLPLKPGEVTADIAYVVGAGQIAFTETPDQLKHGKIELVAVAWDADNKAAGSISQSLVMDLKPATYQNSVREGIRSAMRLQLKPGDYKLRLGIMDDGSGKLGTIELPFQVAGASPAAK